MKDAKAFTNICINQYALERLKNNVSGIETATAMQLHMFRYGQTMLNEILNICENPYEQNECYELFNSSINNINLRGALQ